MAIDAVAGAAAILPQSRGWRQLRKPIVAGIAAGTLLIAVYGVVIVLAQGSRHVVDQSVRQWYWIALLAVGFGTQAGLITFIRQELRKRQKATAAVVGTSGAVSAASMVACCAHHLTDLFATLGIAGASAFLVSYQVPFIVVSVVSNAVGIATMLDVIQKHKLCPIVGSSSIRFGRVKKWMLASSGVIVAAVFVATFLAR